MVAVDQHHSEFGVAPVCEALSLWPSTWYRRNRRALTEGTPTAPRPAPVSALSDEERQRVREVLDSEAFADKTPAEVYATLLSRGEYLCSERTMYRILAEHQEVRERRNQLRHPSYTRPELLATGPNQVWSWDITKLKGPRKWGYYYLYVILDIFSRYVVGWMVAESETAALAQRFIDETTTKEGIEPNQLTLHADRGAAMTSKAVSQLLVDLGVVRSHSRPYTSTDNPYSESQFKTTKYRPDFPRRFEDLDHALSFCRAFFPWYNGEHHHSGIGLYTPSDVHHGRVEEVRRIRQAALDAAYDAHPARFPRGRPVAPQPPTEVYINAPEVAADA